MLQLQWASHFQDLVLEQEQRSVFCKYNIKIMSTKTEKLLIYKRAVTVPVKHTP